MNEMQNERGMQSASRVNLRFKLALLKKFPTMLDGAIKMGFAPSDLSLLVRGRKMPSEKQREKLRRVFTARQMERMFPDTSG